MSDAADIKPVDLKGFTVLFVDDEKTLREHMLRMLTRYGARVLLANNGVDGVATFAQYHPDLVITDIQLRPMDGLAMARQIRALDAEIPIIMISAYDRPEYLLDSIDIGVFKYLLKPLSAEVLERALRSSVALLRKRQALDSQLAKIAVWLDECSYDAEQINDYVNQCVGPSYSIQNEYIRSLNKPMGMLSGDFYATECVDKVIYALLADGAGHGLAAVLPVLQVPELFRRQARKGCSLLVMAHELNQLVYEQRLPGHFLALTLIRLCPEQGYIEVVNCGNPPAILLNERGGVIHEFCSEAPALGVLSPDDFTVNADGFNWEDQARLLVYSDGLTDTLAQLGPALWSGNMKAYLGSIASSEEAFAALSGMLAPALDIGQPDDVTLLELCYRPSLPEPTVKEPGLMPSHPMPTKANESRIMDLSILYVEDNRESRMYFARILRRSAREVFAASTAEEGLRLFRRHRPQLVIADVNMPGMCGISMVEEIRQMAPDIPVIFTGGEKIEANFESMLNAGVRRFLHKPVSVDRLLASIQSCVRHFDQLRNTRLSASVFLNSSLAITIVDANRNIVSVNPSFCRITGYSEEEVLGHNPRILSSGKHDQNFYAEMWQSINATGHWHGEIWNRRKSGELFLEWLTINAIKDEQGNVLNYASIFSDITQRNVAQEKIRRA